MPAPSGALGLAVARSLAMQRRLELALLGTVGGVAGLVAKRVVAEAWNRLIKPRRTDHRSKRSWSLVGEHHVPGEYSNVALARVLYTKVAGHPPSERTLRLLGTGVHWGFGVGTAVLYAVVRDTCKDLDARGGLTLAIAVWALVDEIGMSLAGLQDAPTSYPIRAHTSSLVSHLGYGLAVAATTQTLARKLRP
ncbi:MAG: hypothetical protein JWP01_2842 [Myxococcales bacterium]|jgi:uncharacterized membrane protein YagU involved in acid resistance|nr:hypothetical protein [Myxococcales bacterium]